MDIDARIDTAIKVLKAGCTPDKINEAMANGFEGLLATNGFATNNRSPGGLFVSAMKTGFYANNPAGLSIEHRECAVLAVLVVQGADVNLALHVFIALASGIPVADVRDIVLLAGMYSGANLLSQAMKVVTKTFSAIIKAGDARAQSPAEVFKLIMDEFPDDELAAAREHLE